MIHSKKATCTSAACRCRRFCSILSYKEKLLWKSRTPRRCFVESSSSPCLRSNMADRFCWECDGMVERALTLSLEELLRYPRTDIGSVHQCCGSPFAPFGPTRHYLVRKTRMCCAFCASLPRSQSAALRKNNSLDQRVCPYRMTR